MAGTEFSHKPVLLNETVDSLDIKPDGIYCDCTAGGGGHSALILSRLNNKGRLIAIDRDPEAIDTLNKRFGDDSRVTIVKSEFIRINEIAEELNIAGFDGITADLGVSSHQIDTPERGFSFHEDGPLDMRMSCSGITAADIVNTYSKQDLYNVISKYGEEKYAGSISANIVKYREKQKIETTFQLCDIISASVPAAAKRQGHPARKTFQALRIEVNKEIENLTDSVNNMFDSLNAGGVLSVITFHSLEDKTVKLCFAEYTKGCTCPPDFPVCVCGKTPCGKTKKSIRPSEDEINDNKRARSAKLRSIIKLKNRED